MNQSTHGCYANTRQYEPQSKRKKAHIVQFDFMRAVCALLIVIYHVICMYEGMDSWSYFPVSSHCVNGDWGHTAVVSVFFMLSGASLYYNYPSLNCKDLKHFYVKRWLGIFPTFYFVWCYGFLSQILQVRTVLYAGSPLLFLESLLGLDGYLYYLGVNYTQVGEWFLGALVLLYAFYPVFCYVYRKWKVLTVFVVTALFLINIKLDIFKISDSDNFITCLFSFMLGMLLLETRKLYEGKLWVSAISLVMILLLFLFPLPTNQVILMILLGFFLFLFLYNIAPWIMKIPVLCRFNRFTSSISYEIFLVHHLIIYRFFGYLCEPPATELSVLQQCGCIIAVCFFSLLVAKMVSLFMKWFLSLFGSAKKS